MFLMLKLNFLKSLLFFVEFLKEFMLMILFVK